MVSSLHPQKTKRCYRLTFRVGHMSNSKIHMVNKHIFVLAYWPGQAKQSAAKTLGIAAHRFVVESCSQKEIKGALIDVDQTQMF